jgi:hypothetical protein
MVTFAVIFSERHRWQKEKIIDIIWIYVSMKVDENKNYAAYY